MRRRKVGILVGAVLALLAVTAITGTVAVQADFSSADAALRDDLTAEGLHVVDVKLATTDASLQIVLQGKANGDPNDAWSRTITEREASFLMGSGALPVGPVGVSIVDETGKVLFESISHPNPLTRPLSRSVAPDALDGLTRTLTQDGSQLGVTLRGLTISDEAQGVIVRADETVAGGANQDDQIRWATVGLLGQVRAYSDDSANLGVDLYRASIHDASGATLVDYVVDAQTGYVRAWLAHGIQPVWSPTRPTAAPATSPAG